MQNPSPSEPALRGPEHLHGAELALMSAARGNPALEGLSPAGKRRPARREQPCLEGRTSVEEGT